MSPREVNGISKTFLESSKVISNDDDDDVNNTLINVL